MIGCGASNENTVPTDIQPLTEVEQQAADDYTGAQAIDPKTGQPGN
jgi:hypothetical protein